MWIFNKIVKNNKEVKIESNLKNNLKAMTILDAIMIPENKKYLRLVNFSKEDNIEKYIINNGKGDTLSIYFVNEDILIKGFDHENSLNQFAAEEWNQDFFEFVYSKIPESLKNVLNEDEIDETTFATWYLKSENKWKENVWKDNDGGKKYLLGYIKTNAKEWCDWAKDYYSKEIDVKLIEKVFNNNFNEKDIELMNPTCNSEETMQLINKIRTN